MEKDDDAASYTARRRWCFLELTFFSVFLVFRTSVSRLLFVSCSFFCFRSVAVWCLLSKTVSRSLVKLATPAAL
jgi:hypothetical protein